MKSFTHFLIKTDSRKVNKKVIESLAKVGCFDCFSTRASILEQLEDIRKKATQFHSQIDGQDSLFITVTDESAAIKDSFNQLPEYPQQELLSFEKELLGLYLTNHPLAEAMQQVASQANQKINDLDHTIHQGQIFIFGGVFTRFKEITTKKGQRMAFATLQDQSGSIECIIFPKLYAQHEGKLSENAIAVVKAKVDYRDEELKIIAERITIPQESLLSQLENEQVSEIFIPRKTSKTTMETLGKLLKEKPGNDKVVILIPNGGKPKKMLLPYTVAWSKQLETEIKKLLG